jgi:hypothetical protein
MTSALAVLVTAAAFAFPTGTYQSSISATDLTKGHAGVNQAGYEGTWSLQIQAGRHWTLKNRGPGGHLFRAPPRGGGYTLSGSTAVFADSLSGGSLTARVSYSSGSLKFTVVRSNRPELRVIFGAHPWRKTA